MEDRTQGIVVRVRPLTESSLIVHWLTDRYGRIAAVAKGARRPKSPFRGKLDLFFETSISFRRSSRGDLHVLREVTVLHPFGGLRQDLDRLRQASYAARLVEQLTEADTPLDECYDLIRGFLSHLETQAAAPLAMLILESRLLRALGLDPLQSKESLSAGARALWGKACTLTWQQSSALHPSPAQWRELNGRLHAVLLDHLGYAPPGRDAAVRWNSPAPE